MDDYYNPIWLDIWEQSEYEDEHKWDEDYEDDEERRNYESNT